MKTLKNFMFLFVALTTITLTSCKTDDDGGDGGNAASGTVTAKIDGDSWRSSSQATMATRVTTNGIDLISITANELAAGSSRNITLTMTGLDGTGTYDIGGGSIIAITAAYIEASGDASGNAEVSTWQAPFEDAVAGELNISELSDSSIKGTFMFTAKSADDGSTREITEGSFNLDF